jgi:uncharacterized membrane protein
MKQDSSVETGGERDQAAEDDRPEATKRQKELVRRYAALGARKAKKTSRILFLKHKGKMVFLVLLLVLLLLLVLIFDLLAWIFSDFGAVIICILSVLALVRFVSVLSTFPGSFWFVRRQL